MKLKLLLTILMLFAFKGFAQVTAYPVNDINQCNNEVFDLTINTPIVLGNQSPNEYSVAYFNTLPEAENNTNPIANPETFVSQFGSQTVYVRVENNTTGEFDVTNFYVSWQSTVLDVFEQITACESFELWQIEPNWAYYTGPGGTGTQLQAGDIITTTTTLYIYQAQPCVAEGVMTVTITPPLQVNQPTPLLVCDTFGEPGDGIFIADLTSKIQEITGGMANLTVTFHETQEDAEFDANAITNASAYTPVQSAPIYIYVRVESNVNSCFTVVSFPVAEGPCTNNNLFGTIEYDIDNNGCGTGDLTAAGIPVTYTLGNYVATTYTNAGGEYAFYSLPDGTGTVSVMQNSIFTATPSSQQVTFPDNDAEINFCYAAANPVNDVGIVLVPVTAAQTGFDAYYNIYYYNNGTSAASGTVTLQFDNTNLTYVSSSPNMTVSGNTLIFAYNLMPFATDYVSITFNVSGPNGVTMGGTQLDFTATIDPVTGDTYPNDNINTLTQFVVNSWDPNDITVHEGETITPEETGEYLHYTIRFQNEGDANAVNIVVENPIDSNLDLSTFEPIGSSHSYTTMVEDGVVKFTFSNINLTWADNDEPASHGHVTYRIKPAASVGLNDSMQGGIAGIFFDFNPAILTNTVTTTVQTTMGTGNFASRGFVIYPNPVSDIVNLELNGVETDKADMTITNLLGKTVMAGSLAVNGSTAQVDVSALETGIYFVTLTLEGKTKTQKLVIR